MRGAIDQAHALLARSQSGARRGRQTHIRRAEHIAAGIWRRWHVAPLHWQLKHLRWWLAVGTRDLTPQTRYQHWLTVRRLVAALGRDEDWLPHLSGPWQRPNGDTRPRGVGGRPAKLPGCAR